MVQIKNTDASSCVHNIKLVTKPHDATRSNFDRLEGDVTTGCCTRDYQQDIAIPVSLDVDKRDTNTFVVILIIIIIIPRCQDDIVVVIITRVVCIRGSGNALGNPIFCSLIIVTSSSIPSIYMMKVVRYNYIAAVCLLYRKSLRESLYKVGWTAVGLQIMVGIGNHLVNTDIGQSIIQLDNKVGIIVGMHSQNEF